MGDIIVSHAILKAAKLFTDRPNGNFCRPGLELPWALRLAGKNIIAAFDGHTMLVANDREGKGYRKKPAQVGANGASSDMPGWPDIIRKLPPTRRAFTPVAVNPQYHARVMRAARILEIDMVTMSVGGNSREIIYTIGPDAFAVVMPMRDADRPVVPEWLRKAVMP